GATRLDRAAVRRTATALDGVAQSDGTVKMAAVLGGLAEAGADAALLRSLACSRQASRTIAHLAQGLRQLNSRRLVGDAALRRFLAQVGREHIPAFLQLWQAWQPLEAERLGPDFADRARQVLAAGDPLSPAELAVDGRDIQGAGVPPGPQLARKSTRLNSSH